MILSKLSQSRLWRCDTWRTSTPLVLLLVPAQLSARRGCERLKIERTFLGAHAMPGSILVKERRPWPHGESVRAGLGDRQYPTETR